MNIPRINRLRKFLYLLAADLISFCLAAAIALLINRVSLEAHTWIWMGGTALMLLLFSVLLGLYRMPLRSAGMYDALCICGTISLAALCNIPLVRFATTVRGGTAALFFLVMLDAMLISRFSIRIVRALHYHKTARAGYMRVMVVGAGSAGTMIIHEMQSSDKLRFHPVCVIDDDPAKRRTRIAGVPVVGTRAQIGDMAKRYSVQRIFIAMPAAPAESVREICDICSATGVRTQILPGVYQMLQGTLMLERVRNVEINDLLGRDPVVVNSNEVDELIGGKTVLVTGGGGSIGSELCRQIAERKPKQLIIFDIYENNAYDIQQELLRNHPDLDLVVRIGSVRDKARVRALFASMRPQIVFHAAAHKHVPLMEHSPNEAVKNNVFGTWNTAEAARDYGAEHFVLISTDKAVNPTNVMGATKRICEMVVQHFARHSEATEFVAVRFGNVLGSNGSVIPLFKRQIEAGGPVTVTHKDIIRYFMTIPEAVALVLQAGAFAHGGEIFVLDMGKPVKILTLAENLIRLSGYKPYVDIPIVFSGLRPGEKLYEELLMGEEGLRQTANQRIHIGQPIEIDEQAFLSDLAELKATMGDDDNDLHPIIERLVPTYRNPAKSNIPVSGTATAVRV